VPYNKPQYKGTYIGQSEFVGICEVSRGISRTWY